MLEVVDMHVHYGAIHALKGVSLKVEEGSIVTLIGANGAGKSTTLRALSGLLKPSKGSVRFAGIEGPKELVGERSHRIVRLGLSHCPEGRRVFPRLTVKENLELGAFIRKDAAAIKQDLDQVFELFPRLKERLKQAAGTLSGGEQQMLAIGRAFMGRPRLLMLDEPSLGIAPLLVQEIFKTIKQINATQRLTILLVEQNANQALKLAHYAYVLETGKVVLHGKAQELAEDPRVKAAYLGH
jgi:branched-chain amino acid transport system ATP-binding protein